ncbi:unnamed protein product [Rotaria socialis]|uniref:Uncharacterized protein n=1 Tax=Rotaria socialis TaxID=392032 RepID=A0A820LG98_9BILA|nr:unnamed protein product [Rotaria socialis]CAF3322867.1 unnamed protein product [Rotaria socialis]CAF3472085.1 unnamed protein product [Rotaria socialis]CAF3785398.1 unnamed protein product [Rotaria socialis]CAF4321767.1 unnamed protein product [Rotaria socialis]
MVSTTAPKFGVRFPTRKERTVKRVTKCETREIQKRLEPPKPVRVRPPPKPKAPKKPPPPPATLCKPPKPPRTSATHANERQPSSTSQTQSTSSSSSSKPTTSSLSGARTLQAPDLEKLARLNCSREFSLFHKFIKPELSRSYENQLGFLQTKLQHLKNEFVNKQAEHLNFEQIRDYYNEAVKENVRRHIKPDEYLTLADKFKQDAKQAIDKWLRKKDIKPQRQITEFLQRRQARIRDRIKETLEEAKKQQQLTKEGEAEAGAGAETEVDTEVEVTESTIIVESPALSPITTTEIKPTTMTIIEDDEIMIID